MALALSRTPELDIEKCVTNIGDRNQMIVIAATRARELQRKHKASGSAEHRSFGVDALFDIQHGCIGPDYIHNLK